jgi:uncharacterized DUF497 family protein
MACSKHYGDRSSIGRALDCGSSGCGFKPHRSPFLFAFPLCASVTNCHNPKILLTLLLSGYLVYAFIICLTKSIFSITIAAKRCKVVRIYELIIEPGREEHIACHQVSVSEVEEVIFGEPFIRKARSGRCHVIGQTEAGRYLAVFIAPREYGVYGLVTARDADYAERKAYLQHRRQKRI